MADQLISCKISTFRQTAKLPCSL